MLTQLAPLCCRFWSRQAVKHFVLVGDLLRSVSLCYWDVSAALSSVALLLIRSRHALGSCLQPTLKQLIPLGRDYDFNEVYACEFIIDGTNLNVVVSAASCRSACSAC